MRPVISSSAPKVSQPPAARPASRAGRGPAGPSRSGAGAGGSARLGTRGLRGAAASGVVVRRMARGAEDGYHSDLVPGLKSSSDARRLADELAFAAGRLQWLAERPFGLWAEVSGTGDAEERLWLAFLIAYIGPASGEDELEDPFAAVATARVPWGGLPRLEGVVGGPRGAFDPARAEATVRAYQAWAARAGSQEAGFVGDAAWTPERRFARVFERLGTLPGLTRDVRFELLSALGTVGAVEVRAGALGFGGENEATVAAKRVFGIGDTLLLERRAADLAEAAGIELAALDLGLHNWGVGRRLRGGAPAELEAPEPVLGALRAALGL